MTRPVEPVFNAETGVFLANLWPFCEVHCTYIKLILRNKSLDVLHIFINQWFYQKISSSTLSFQTFQVREAPANQEPQVIAGHIQSDAPCKITGYHKHIPCKKKQLEKTQLHTYIYIYKSIKLASPKYQVFFCSSAVLNRSRKDLPGMAKLRYSKV